MSKKLLRLQHLAAAHYLPFMLQQVTIIFRSLTHSTRTELLQYLHDTQLSTKLHHIRK